MDRREDRPTRFGKNPPRALVIEDDAALRRLLERILTELGCIVASSAAEARLSAAAGLWDLVFVDLGLLDADGLDLLPELIRSLHERPRRSSC